MAKDRRIAGSRNTTLAGTLLQTLMDMETLGLKTLTLDGISKVTGASRSQAYEWAARTRGWRATQAGPGRPRKDVAPAPVVDARVFEAVLGVRDWAFSHPGAVCTGQKRTAYSDGFRSYVLDLVAPGGPLADFSQVQAARLCGVPYQTLVSWLAAGKRISSQSATEDETADPGEETTEAAIPAEPHEPLDEAPETIPTPAPAPEAPAYDTTTETPLPTSQWAAQAAQVLDLWDKWSGPFGAFCASLSNHGIRMSPTMVSAILSLSGKRKRRPRRTANPDPEAIRGELVRLFPNAQWNADGKSVLVGVGDQVFRFTMELVVDTATTAHLGFSLREHEDSKGLLGAMDQATASTGEPPIGMLRDARKCNVSEAVETRLSEDGVISMVSTIGRPQNNAPAENAFSLLEQKLPVPALPSPETLSPIELGRLVMAYMLLGVCVGRNHTPRNRLRGRTPAQVFAESQPTEEERAQAKEELRRLKRQVEAQAQHERLRCKPATLEIVREALDDLGLSDPKDRFAPAIARHGMEAALEAVSIFRAKRKADTLPETNQERYMLGIARNVAYRTEDLRTYEGLLDLRARARDLLLVPLEEHDSDLRSRLSDSDYLPAVLDLALSSEALVDRTYWRRKLLDALESLPLERRTEMGRHCARKIAARQSLHHHERDLFISEVARRVVPLAA